MMVKIPIPTTDIIYDAKNNCDCHMVKNRKHHHRDPLVADIVPEGEALPLRHPQYLIIDTDDDYKKIEEQIKWFDNQRQREIMELVISHKIDKIEKEAEKFNDGTGLGRLLRFETLQKVEEMRKKLEDEKRR